MNACYDVTRYIMTEWKIFINLKNYKKIKKIRRKNISKHKQLNRNA